MHVDDKNGFGYLTFALNSDVDYESCALLWALSLRATQKLPVKIAVVVNDAKSCRSELHDVCDHVISVPKRPVVNNMQYEADILHLTPFKETVKFEADMLVPCDLEIWKHRFRLQDLCITGSVQNHKRKKANDLRYRQFINENLLPNAYNGLYYVRVTKQNVAFFKELDRIFNNWDDEIKKFRLWRDHEPSTDFGMSMALRNLGMDDCVSTTSLPTFVHNKEHCVGNWQYFSIPKPDQIIVNGAKITVPWHYHDKTKCTEDLISKYKAYV